MEYHMGGEEATPYATSKAQGTLQTFRGAGKDRWKTTGTADQCASWRPVRSKDHQSSGDIALGKATVDPVTFFLTWPTTTREVVKTHPKL